MEEQKNIIDEKIMKREKIDSILAYILIVVLLGAILLVLYLKFIRNSDEEIAPEEYTPNYISLSEISNSFNSSDLIANYENDNAALSSNAMGGALNIDYLKEENKITLNIPLIDSQLKVEYNEENKNIVEAIYKELASIVCVYNGNIEDACRNIINNININNQIDGIKLVQSGDITTVYIDIMKKIDVNGIITYKEITPVDISNTNYILVLQNTQINNININSTSTNVTFEGNVKSLNEDNNLRVVVKLYDVNNNLLEEKSYEYTESNPLNGDSVFEISFELSDNLKLENINKYSIEVVK